MRGIHQIRPVKPEQGQAMVEFMLVIIFIFVLFISMIQMILLMHAYNTLADSAKEGVRYAIVHGTQNSNCSGPNSSTICTTPDTTGANVQTAVTNFAGLSFQNVTSAEVQVVWGPKVAGGGACNDPGCSVTVTVSHTYLPFFGFSWPAFPLNAAAQGRIMN